MVTYTTSDFVDAVQLNAHVPQGNATFTAAQFLAIGNTQMRTKVAPKIASCRENYWLATEYIDIDPDTNRYAIPSKSIGSSFTDIKVASGTNLIHLMRLEVSDLYSTQFSTFSSYGYYLEDGSVRLLPTTLSGQVVFWYYRIPSKLVPVSECAQILSITDNAIEVASVPTAFINGGELDIVSQSPGFNVLLKDTEPTSIVGTTLTFSSVPSDIAVGDWVCLSGQSCIIQCPLEWIEVLVQQTVCKVYQIQGYAQKLKLALDDLKEMETNAMSVVSPRTVESAKIISGGGSLLTSQNRGWSLPVRGS